MAAANVTALCRGPCGEVKPLIEFSWVKATGKPHSYCKACRRQMARDFTADHPNHRKDYNDQYRADNLQALRRADRIRRPKPPKVQVLTLAGPGQHQCTGPCGFVKPLSEFNIRENGKPRNVCKQCMSDARPKMARETPYTDTGRICTGCGKDKPLTEFWERGDQPGKYRSECKECIDGKTDPVVRAERARQWRIDNPERERENMRAWRAANEDHLAQYESERWDRYKAEIAAGLRPEPDRRAAAAWHREYAKKFPNRIRLNRLAWLAANPLYERAASAKRRALVRDAPGTHTAAELEALWITQGGICAYCSRSLVVSGKRVFHEEHDIPLTRNGSNDISNIVLACPSCNCRKHNKTGAEFRALLAEEAERLAKKTKKR